MNHHGIKSALKHNASGCGPFSRPSGSTDSLRLSIFERVRAEGSVSRAKIAKELSISPATVTQQTSALIELGLVREETFEEPGATTRGRPPIGLTVVPNVHFVAGVKLSDQKHTAVIYDFSGRQIASSTLPALHEPDFDSLVRSTEKLITLVCEDAQLDLKDLSAIGIGIPGFVDSKRGVVRWTPLVSEKTIDFAGHMKKRLGLDIICENDANLIALAELWFGVGRRISDFAVVTIEHGVGMGLVINHKLYAGARGIGMELGHTKVALNGALCRCGQRGCLEAYVADYALVREAAFASKAVKPDAPTPEILEALYRDAKNGNNAAKSIFERAGQYLAMGLGNVANLFDPELIILSGERMRYDYLYSDDILEEMKRHALDTGIGLPPIEVHARGDMVWASGAAALALSHVTEGLLSDVASTSR